jgi:hypothetical protein
MGIGAGVFAAVVVTVGLCVLLGNRPGDNGGTEQALFFFGLPVLSGWLGSLGWLIARRWRMKRMAGRAAADSTPED